jgi:hypothetical protein
MLPEKIRFAHSISIQNPIKLEKKGSAGDVSKGSSLKANSNTPANHRRVAANLKF